MYPNTNLSVLSFFIFGAISFAYLSYFYLKQKKPAFRLFGFSLALISLALAIWSYVVFARPANLILYTTIGVVPFVLSFGSLLACSATTLNTKYRKFIYIFALIFISIFGLLRIFFYASSPAFDSQGFFYFNADPVILYMYAMAISFSILPAIYVLGRQIKNVRLRILMELGFTLVAISAIILIISYDNWLQIINGWGMIIALLILLIAHTRYRLDKTS